MKKPVFGQAILLSSIIVGGLTTGAHAQVDLETEGDRFSYGLGMMIGERILKQYGEVDYEKLLEGMKAQHQGEATALSVQDAGAAIQARQQALAGKAAEENRARGEAYLASNAERDGVTVTDSGLQYEVLQAAEGAKPAASDQVRVHYRGTLIDGTEFDSSYSRNSPATFGLSQVIPGWTEGLQLMNVGSKYRFVIPHQIGYGERGAGERIGPYETLVFEVELLEINP